MLSPTFLNFPLFNTFLWQIWYHAFRQWATQMPVILLWVTKAPLVYQKCRCNMLDTCVRRGCAAVAGLILGLVVTAWVPLFVDFPDFSLFGLGLLAGVVLCSWASFWQEATQSAEHDASTDQKYPQPNVCPSLSGMAVCGNGFIFSRLHALGQQKSALLGSLRKTFT